MKPINRKILCLLCAFALVFGCCTWAFGSSLSPNPSGKDLDDIINKTADYICSSVPEPSFGKEWIIIGLARSGCQVPDGYFDKYFASVEATVKNCKGVLHNKKYTEYSRVILALTAIGRDARNVGGFDLTYPLGDYKKTAWQGLNGIIWALIALDSGNYPMPCNREAEVKATRQMYVDEILSRQLEDGGWNLTDKGGKGKADTDITAMALQALAAYTERRDVQEAVNRALECLSKMQEADGGFSSWDIPNSESCSQVIVALNALGLSVLDEAFVKNGNNAVGKLLSYRLAEGSFMHTKDWVKANAMATEQAFYALVSLKRFKKSSSRLYLMTDSFDVLADKLSTATEVNPSGGEGAKTQSLDCIKERIKKLVTALKNL